jgi:hypothetical protein
MVSSAAGLSCKFFPQQFGLLIDKMIDKAVETHLKLGLVTSPVGMNRRFTFLIEFRFMVVDHLLGEEGPA